MFYKEKNKRRNIISQNYIYSKVKKKRIRFILIFFYLVSAILFFSAVVYFIIFGTYFNIKNVSFSDMKTIEASELNDVYLKYMDKKNHIFLNQKNILTLSKSSLIETFKSSFRRIKDVKIERDLPFSLDISIVEYSPIGIACSGFESKDILCFLFDEDGIIFDSTPLIISDLFLLVYDNDIVKDSFPFQKYSKEKIDFSLRFKKTILREGGLLVDYFKFKDKFNDIEVMLKSGFKLFLSQDISPEKQGNAVVEILNNEIKKKAIDLDYIDLRIKNKAYYKFKQDNIDGDDTKADVGLQ